MRITILALLLAATVHAAETSVTPEMQAILDAQKKIIVEWAADPVIIDAVRAQNVKGPLPGMDNLKWTATEPGDPIVRAFQHNPAGQFLTEKLKASKGVLSEAFLSAAKGEKVAFAEMTTRYNHQGMPKFDVPMSGKDWQGEPEYDESSQAFAVQISTPVLDNGKAIGVLVLGVALKHPGAK
jgi:hypothetical protein